MAYPEGALAPGEALVLHKHPHWKLLAVPVLALVATVAVASFVAGVVRRQEWAHTAWIALAVAAVVVVGWATLAPVLRWRTTHLVLTDRRLLVREGVFTRTGIDLPTDRITSVQLRQGLLARVLGTGTLVVESAADEPLEFDDVPQVQRVHTLLYTAVFHAGDGERRVPQPPLSESS